MCKTAALFCLHLRILYGKIARQGVLFMSKITIPDNSILLLEGGSLRGLFTAGVLDTFMENDVYFPAVAGVSAGSLNAVNYASHQQGRSASINLRYRHDSRYFGPKAALRGGSLFGLKFMLNDVKKEVPFDEETFAHGGMRVIAVATNVETGKPAYFEKGKTDFPFDEAVRASASLPLASVPVVLDGQPYLDGGCSCPIALNWALNEGFEKIVVITTRQKGFRKTMPGQRMVDLYDDFYSDKPLFLADMLTQELRYNTLMDQLDELEADGRICCVRPQEPITIGRFEGDENKLLDLYNRGHREAREALDKVREIVLRLNSTEHRLTLPALAVDGNDMKALGYSGREIGAALNELLEKVLDGALENCRESLMAYAEKGRRQHV